MQMKAPILMLVGAVLTPGLLATIACSSTSNGTAKFSCTSTASACVEAMAGDFSGTFAGAESGTWSASFSKSGATAGTAKVGDQVYALTGKASANGNFIFGSGPSGIEFSGEVFVDGTVSGTWVLEKYSGTFEGKRSAGAIVVTGPADAAVPPDPPVDASPPDPPVDAGPSVFNCTGTTIACYAAMAGNYSGTYSGDGAGTWKAVVATNGAITGSANAGELGTLALSGKADPKGLLVFGNASKGAQFSGTLYVDGSVDGTWALAMGQGKFIGLRKEGALKMP